jgi:hypothetical protein
MNRATRRDVLAFALGAGLWPAMPVSAGEIEEVLTGNMIEGDWAGRPSKQYFDAFGYRQD